MSGNHRLAGGCPLDGGVRRLYATGLHERENTFGNGAAPAVADMGYVPLNALLDAGTARHSVLLMLKPVGSCRRGACVRCDLRQTTTNALKEARLLSL